MKRPGYSDGVAKELDVCATEGLLPPWGLHTAHEEGKA